MSYSELSTIITKSLTNSQKKKDGIYFTPPDCIIENIELLKPYMDSITHILEPSCGTCEYITYINTLYQKNITGIEYNEVIFNSVKHLSIGNTEIIKYDYLTYESTIKYDLIIGNPPYYVMSKTNVNKDYYMYFTGRPNIFILFIIKSLTLLNDGGILSFVLPKSFMNCSYYDKTRSYINKSFQILCIKECKGKYIDTQQETIIFIVRKQSIIDNSTHVLLKAGYTIFSHNITELYNLYKNSTSLSDLDFKVNVGNVVWNQCKDILTNDSTHTRLIYSSDIIDNKLSMKSYKNIEKQNYINKPGFNNPVLVVNRGYGSGAYKLSYCLIDGESEYLIENHLICIIYNKQIDKEALLAIYNKIIVSLNDSRTTDFMKLYCGNNAINTTELNHILPIYFI